MSGEASEAFWTVALASLAPPQLRPIALGSAVVFGTAVGGLRVVFGRHFVTDVVFAGILTIIVVTVLYRLLLDPVRRNDARLERGDRAVLVGLAQGGIGALLTWAGARPRRRKNKKQAPRDDGPALAQAPRLPIVAGS